MRQEIRVTQVAEGRVRYSTNFNDRWAIVSERDAATFAVERSDGVAMAGAVSPWFARRYAVNFVTGAD
jgi:hypothetical protein